MPPKPTLSSNDSLSPSNLSPSNSPGQIIVHRIDPDHYSANKGANQQQRDNNKHDNQPIIDGSVATPVKAVPVAVPQTVVQRALREASSGLGGAIFSACCVYVSHTRHPTNKCICALADTCMLTFLRSSLCYMRLMCRRLIDCVCDDDDVFSQSIW